MKAGTAGWVPMRKEHAPAALGVLIAAGFLFVLPTTAADDCTPVADFWNALAMGQNPLPAVITASQLGWQLESFAMRWVTIEDGQYETVRGEDVGFRLYRVAGQPADSPAMLWGTPQYVRGLVGHEGTLSAIASDAIVGGVLCIRATPVISDPSFPPLS